MVTSKKRLRYAEKFAELSFVELYNRKIEKEHRRWGNNVVFCKKLFSLRSTAKGLTNGAYECINGVKKYKLNRVSMEHFRGKQKCFIFICNEVNLKSWRRNFFPNEKITHRIFLWCWLIIIFPSIWGR